MSWVSVIPVVGVGLAVFLIPGALLGWAAKARGFSLIATAPVLSTAIASLTAFLAPFLGLRWSPWLVLAASFVFAVAAYLVRYLLRARWPDPAPVRSAERAKTALATLFAAVLAAFLIGRRLIQGFGSPDAISQTYDNTFHLNALRYIENIGNASPLNLGHMTGITLYPAGWHDMTSLVAALSGASIPVVVNGVSMVIGAVVWPLSCLYLIQTIMGRRIIPILLTGIVAAGFSAFPLLMVDWGVLYPNLLSISLLPAALGLLINALGLGKLPDFSWPVRWCLVAASAAAVAMAHPSTLIALLLFAVPCVLARYWFKARTYLPVTSRTVGPLLLLTAVFLGGLILLGIGWELVRPPEDAAGWQATQSSAQALGEIFMSAPMGRPAAGVIGIFLITGIVVLIRRRRQLWLLLIFAGGALLFFYASGMEDQLGRGFLTGTWYYDSRRLAALLPVATLPLVVAGGTFLWEKCYEVVLPKVLRFVDSRPTGLRKLLAGPQTPLAGIMIAIFLVTWGTQHENIRTATESVMASYAAGDNALLLSDDERELIERLPDTVEAGAVIAGMPSNGSALAYALADREVVQIHILTTHGRETDIVLGRLKYANLNPTTICKAVKNLNVRYVLDFGKKSVTGPMAGYNGVVDIASSGAVQLVDSEGRAKLYKVTACW